MSILSAENISHSFNDKWLFKDLTFSIHAGDRIALVGHNGSGKSTLLKIITGILLPEKGNIVKNDQIEIGYLEQDFTYTQDDSVHDFIFKTENKIQDLISRYESLISNPSSDATELQIIMDQMTALDAWDYENRYISILDRLGIIDRNAKLSTLSGGEKKRLALAKLLITDPDIYILDEPTNHLDIETIEWLEQFLLKSNKTVLFVSHDRYFLDNLCTEIREINQATIYTYKGKYADFIEGKSAREEIEEVISEKAKNLLRRELEWMRKQPKARGTKSKSRIDAFYDLEKQSKSPSRRDNVTLSSIMSRQGRKVLELHDIRKNYSNKKIFDSFSYIFKREDKIGLIGKNGSGKTTFLKILAGESRPDSGIIDFGETTKIGYYKQEGLNLPEDKRVIEVVTDVAEYIEVKNGENITASQLLTRFLFPPEKQYDFVHKLSGGEKKRLQLMRVLITNPNFLILDEPSNDLDIDTLNILEEFLEAFKGVLILVSHDRYLIDKLCSQLFVMGDSSSIRIYNGNYSSYISEKEELLKNKEKKKETIKDERQETKEKEKKKLSYKEKIELEGIENEIELLEGEIENLTQSLSLTTDYKELEEISKSIKTQQLHLDEKMERWVYLSNFG